MNVDLTDPIFTNEDAARAHFERLRWPNGPVCPRCGTVDNAVELKGKSTRPGLYKCRECRKPFTATIGTLYERSHIPLHKWLLATHLMCASKKGIAAHQLFRMLWMPRTALAARSESVTFSAARSLCLKSNSPR